MKGRMKAENVFPSWLSRSDTESWRYEGILSYNYL